MIPPAAVTAASLLQPLLVALVTALIGALLAYGVGVRVTALWDERKRRREADLTALAEYYRLYGAFFTTWKLWDSHKSYDVGSPPDAQWALLQRAENAEGGFEALLVKLVAERELDAVDVELLGCFREGYQTLRETIRADKLLCWPAGPPIGDDAPRPDRNPPDAWTGFQQYQAFKGLTEHFAVQLAKYSRPRESATQTVFEARLLAVTSAHGYRADWWVRAARHLRLPDAEPPDEPRAVPPAA